jgi:hypothetical protein
LESLAEPRPIELLARGRCHDCLHRRRAQALLFNGSFDGLILQALSAEKDSRSPSRPVCAGVNEMTAAQIKAVLEDIADNVYPIRIPICARGATWSG